MTLVLPTSSELSDQLREWLPEQRWFSARERAITGVDIPLRVPVLESERLVAEHLLVTVSFDVGADQQYQIPLGYRAQPAESLLPWALPAVAERAFAYDGLHDPHVCARYARALASSETIGPLRFRTLEGDAIKPGPGRPLGGEQSNTSVVFDESLLLKMFRKPDPGINPDVEIHRALSEVGSENVAPLLGWVEADVSGEPTTLAMAQEYIANSADGWNMALISVRDLFAEADLHADELGSDFAGEAERLGVAVAHVHAELADYFGTSVRPAGDGPLPGMRERLDAAAKMIDGVAEQRDAVLRVFEAAADSGPTVVQRIHGDLHLGQVLRTPWRWLLIDFEGEPLKTVAQRRTPDSPLRDVAGMLRSFDYAGHHLLGESAKTNTSQRAFRAAEWAHRNASAFCDGYTSVTGSDPRDQSALLRAYELDKAIYEAVYEARHRPDWLTLPVRAIARLVVE
ncbi:hypothetical protein FOS14_08005 [Skermania sp. ID1734]|uniref:maltokinase N-terminal cap-like domain-containing protein n=1 Tax=Skermania sp. ID1734 TaxID=2597516 RepID=UPI00117C4379|nr:hypothetical protein [Skermania sp. ID1734]TSE00360.1 hypothetical protein FOS14_08005 [Skermania sp. ID1734]